MHAQLIIATLIGLAAAIQDIACRKVSNWIPLAGFAAGVFALTIDRGWRGALSALGGSLAGFLVFLVFYWLGGMGGGDVKLMATLGAVVGIERLWAAALWTAACGGILAALCLGFTALWNLCRRGAGTARTIETIPYAPAIALGSWLALLPGTR